MSASVGRSGGVAIAASLSAARARIAGPVPEERVAATPPPVRDRGDAAVAAVVFAALSLLGQHTWGTVDAIQRFAVTWSLVERGSAVTPEFGPVKYAPLQSVLMIPTAPAREGTRRASPGPIRARWATGRRPSSSRRSS